MILITGQTGSGKTSILKALNYKNTYYADDFVKNTLYKKDHPVFESIKSEFPTVIKNNEIDTKDLGKLLFADKSKMDYVVNIIQPYLEDWIYSLPKNSIIEMAGYINYENLFCHLFSKVIVIERKNKDSSKLNYVKSDFQPIDRSRPRRYDYVVNNDGSIVEAALELKEIIFDSGAH